MIGASHAHMGKETTDAFRQRRQVRRRRKSAIGLFNQHVEGPCQHRSVKMVVLVASKAASIATEAAKPAAQTASRRAMPRGRSASCTLRRAPASGALRAEGCFYHHPRCDLWAFQCEASPPGPGTENDCKRCALGNGLDDGACGGRIDASTKRLCIMV